MQNEHAGARQHKTWTRLIRATPSTLQTEGGTEARGVDQGNEKKVAAPETGCQSWLAADVDAEAADLENLMADEVSWDSFKVLRLPLNVP